VNEPKILRKYRTVQVSLTTSVLSATTVPWQDAAGGAIELGTASSAATSIQVWASEIPDGTFGRLFKVDGSAADITLSSSTSESRVYPLPDEAYPCGAIRLVAGQAAGTAATCVVMVKT
jgi:hypothetical protein